MSRSALLLVLVIALPSSGAAQATVLEINEGFVERTVTVRTGGNDEISECGFGYTRDEQWVAINYEAAIISDPGASDLYFWVESDDDTMIMVMYGEGDIPDVACDDDSHSGLNPLVRIADAPHTIYGVWVGSLASGRDGTTTLHIASSRPLSRDGPSASSTRETATRPDLAGEPTYGRISLSGAFSPDPYTRTLSAGGNVDVDLPGCGYGYVASAPDLNVTYTGSGNALYFFVRSDQDTTLLINRPDGSWICDDDSLGDSNPVVTIPNAGSGLYNIWVGTYSDGDLASATLYISAKGAK